MRTNSLAFRLFAFAAIWSLIVLPIAAATLVSLYRGAVERAFDARLLVHLTNLVAATTTEGGAAPAEPDVIGEPLFGLPLSGWYWRIGPMQPDTRPLFKSESLLDVDLIRPLSEGAEPDEARIRRANTQGPYLEPLRAVEREITLGEGGPSFSYVVAGDSSEIADETLEFTVMVVAVLALLGVGLVAGALVQVRYGLRPLRVLGENLAAIRSGEAEKLEGRYPVEIEPLQEELNALITTNHDIVERARTHVGNLAHALKTPLSVIVNEARGADSPLAVKVREQAALMQGQVTHHLDRARVAARVNIVGGVTDVAPVLAALGRTLERIYGERGIEVAIDCADGLRFRGERQDFEEMVGNLMDNACKWAKRRVTVTCAAAHGRLAVSVADDGPGLSQEERAEVVKRGQRLDESKPGSGLGLSIVADLAHLYEGALRLEAARSGGLDARLDLPLA
jgi:signal transduction histidine kinase